MFALQSSAPWLVYRIPLKCQLQLPGNGCLEQWSEKDAEVTLGSVERMPQLISDVCQELPHVCHPCETAEEISLLRWMVWEDNQTWFWNWYIYLCKWTNRSSDNQSISVSFTWGCSFGWTEKMEGLSQRCGRTSPDSEMPIPEKALLKGSCHSLPFDVFCVYYLLTVPLTSPLPLFNIFRISSTIRSQQVSIP